MGLLQKKPIVVSKDLPLYTISGQLTLLLVGLGNPGKKYEGTRHNIGFACLDNFAAKHPEFSHWTQKKDLKCSLTIGTFGSTRVIAVKPNTFMNNSGQAVQAAQAFYRIDPARTAVIYDELTLPFGQIRMRSGGSSAGHNGIKSIIEHLSDGFNRVRVGIANNTSSEADSANFVLKAFSAKEKEHIPALLAETDSILTEYVYRGELASETRNFII